MKYLTLFCLLFLSATVIAQRGPGGVTDDRDNNKNCRLWLDAGDLITLADGDPVEMWHDKSISLIDDYAFWDPADASDYSPPTFRDALSAGINGKPVVSYQDGGMLKLGHWDGHGANGPASSPDINTNENTYEQSIFIAFRTGNNVTDRQNLWEEGGTTTGFKVYIRDGSVFIAVYDGATSPKFQFAYKKLSVQSNTTYVLSYIYDVPTNNQLITNTNNPALAEYTGMTGTLNGKPFPEIMEFGTASGFPNNGGIGAVGPHPDPIGVGGLNRTSTDENSKLTPQSVYSGTRLFQGRIAEICYYAYALNKVERIIVENYLAAKYFANVIENDMFDYEATYGDGVIGVGKEPNIGDHNISQGDNLFEISVNISQAFPLGVPQYIMVGHDNNQINWTKQNTPDSSSIQRLRRIWRWDRRDAEPEPSNKQVKIKLYPEDIAKLPPLPPGYTKYGILQEHTSSYLPNFNSANSTVTELYTYNAPYSIDQTPKVNVTIHEASVNIEDGEFFTLCAIKPTAEFELYSDYAIESDPTPNSFPKSVKLVLNYKPAPGPGATIGYIFKDGTAVDGIDYNKPSQNSVSFGNGATKTNITFDIINNEVATPPPTKKLNIILDPTNSDINIGKRDTLDFSIYDDDPEPKITFVLSDSTVSEVAGTGWIRVRVTGTTDDPTQVRIIRPQLAIAGTATYNTDYELSDADGWYDYETSKRAITLTIPEGTNQTAKAYFTVLPDNLNEYDETIHFSVEPLNGVGVGDGSILQHTITIADANVEPVVSFASPSSEGYESINNPRLYVVLNTPSAKQVTVPYSYVGGSATPSPEENSDFSAASNGTLVFAAGETEKYIELIVYSGDEPNEPDETVIFELDMNPTHAVLGTPSQHTYTIKEYTGFEWKGVAGVGKFPDNTFWMYPDGVGSTSNVSNVPNLSPRPITLVQDKAANRPSITTVAGGRNNHKLVEFNGTTQYLKVGGKNGQNPLVNTGGFYDRKSIFFVFSPEKVNSDHPQVIYEQGSSGKGLSIYIIQNKLYFYAWCYDLEEYSPWGFVDNASTVYGLGQAYIESTTNLVAGQFYVVSCHYSRNMGYTSANMPPMAGLHFYINGISQGSYTLDSDGNNGVGRIYTHGAETAIGCSWHQTKIHNSTSKGPEATNDLDYFFKGKIGEFLYFNEPTMNEARARILHNYLASKYNIPLGGGTQDFDLDYADNTPTAQNPDFSHQMAGIGREGGAVHGHAQGRSSQSISELTVTNPVFTQPSAFLNWGNNGEALSNTWPYSNAYLPAGIRERSGKTWRFSANPPGGISAVDLYIRFSDTENADAFQNDDEYLKLLVSTSDDPADFSSAIVYAANINSGNVAEFSAIPVSDGMYIALANTSAIYPLPIELLSFTAKMNGDYVDLNWATSSETNNEYFMIERASEDLHWKEIGEISGAGNSNTTLYYNEKDRNPLFGISYYRLKQVDFDGKYKYSDVVSVVNSKADTSDDIYLFPNPSKSGMVYLRLPSAFAKAAAKVSIFNVSGVIVYETVLNEGSILRELRYGNLSPGIYFVNVNLPYLNETKKLVVQ